MKKKWKCDICKEVLGTKKELIEHLKDEWNEADMTANFAVDQLEYLGVENPYQ